MRDMEWVRHEWTQSPWVSKSSTFAIAGHSNGALQASYIAANTNAVSLVSLGGEFGPYAEFFRSYFADDRVPKFFMWARNNSAENILAYDYLRPAAPYHLVQYTGEHWDYLESAYTAPLAHGPCDQMPELTADLVTLYIGLTFSSLTSVMLDLSKPIVNLTLPQQVYAFRHLQGLDAIHPGCSIDLQWDMAGEQGIKHIGF